MGSSYRRLAPSSSPLDFRVFLVGLRVYQVHSHKHNMSDLPSWTWPKAISGTSSAAVAKTAGCVPSCHGCVSSRPMRRLRAEAGSKQPACPSPVYPALGRLQDGLGLFLSVSCCKAETSLLSHSIKSILFKGTRCLSSLS